MKNVEEGNLVLLDLPLFSIYCVPGTILSVVPCNFHSSEMNTDTTILLMKKQVRIPYPKFTQLLNSRAKI